MSFNFRCAFILVQKEFADKLLAKSGSNDYSKLSVVTQLMSKIEHVLKVSKNSYSPPLNIDTCFVKIQLRSPKVPIDVMEFERLLKFCFNRKNKLLSSNLNCPQFHSHIVDVIECDKKEASRLVLQIIANCDFKTTRPSKMHVEDFLKLLLEFKKTGVSF
ncbi:DIM1 [Hepatospora eriocheir]|uniref:rRNA adenine N(6)-methyltransferase n=1 Tax=Hepatospora eriocheir TaxID=1081669 RepID=A0A1X0QA48_9MICR|nr:DIM1 [Hepatospora eriocheir]